MMPIAPKPSFSRLLTPPASTHFSGTVVSHLSVDSFWPSEPGAEVSLRRNPTRPSSSRQPSRKPSVAPSPLAQSLTLPAVNALAVEEKNPFPNRMMGEKIARALRIHFQTPTMETVQKRQAGNKALKTPFDDQAVLKHIQQRLDGITLDRRLYQRIKNRKKLNANDFVYLNRSRFSKHVIPLEDGVRIIGSPIFAAIQYKNLDALRELIQNGFSVDSTAFFNKGRDNPYSTQTALYFAVSQRSYMLTKLLLDFGADAEALSYGFQLSAPPENTPLRGRRSTGSPTPASSRLHSLQNSFHAAMAGSNHSADPDPVASQWIHEDDQPKLLWIETPLQKAIALGDHAIIRLLQANTPRFRTPSLSSGSSSSS